MNRSRKEIIATIVPLLRFHDRDFYGRRMRPRQVHAGLLSKYQVDSGRVALWKVARQPRVCEFWCNPAVCCGRRTPRRYCFTEQEWAEFARWGRMYLCDIDSRLDTYASVTRRMRHAGLPANTHVAREVLGGLGVNLDGNPQQAVKSGQIELQDGA
jgi:hypothetical protein